MTKRHRKKCIDALSLVLPVLLFFAVLNCFTTYLYYQDYQCKMDILTEVAAGAETTGMDIVKVSIMGICGMMLGFILKETRPEFAALVTMMTGFLILGLAAGKVSYLFETMNRLRESFPIDSSYLTVLVKIIGITYIGQFSSAICKDAGYQMIGTQIDLFCKLSVMVLSMPVLLAILDTISEFMI